MLWLVDARLVFIAKNFLFDHFSYGKMVNKIPKTNVARTKNQIYKKLKINKILQTIDKKKTIIARLRETIFKN